MTPTMKLTNVISGLGVDENFFSCEFFPPKTTQGVENLISRCKRLANLGSLFMSLTWSSGGVHADSTLQLISRIQEETGAPTVLHLTCTNMDRSVLDTSLKQAKAAGIRNILALRGDPPREDYNYRSSFTNAADLVRYIRQEHGDYFCIGVAGYPEGHYEGPSAGQSVEHDLPYLVEKIEAGAEFIVTQLVFDVDKMIDYAQLLRQHPSGLFSNIPILPGIMPINSFQQFVRASKLSHASVPPKILEEITALDTKDDSQVKAYGIQLMAEIITKLQENGINGAHFYTLNLEKSVAQIVQRTGLINRVRASRNMKSRASAETTDPAHDGWEPNSRASSPSANATSWDDFTNGRFTDPASAAFGEIDGYGPQIHGTEDGAPHTQWGTINKVEDISALFIGHITNEISVIPFSDHPLSSETALIQEELIEMNKKNLWTLSSQPCTDGAPSTDRIFGWGPAGGKVYQKEFVEFFASKSAWEDLKKQISPESETITYYVADEQGEVETNDEKAQTHAVTWGVWNGKKNQSTFINAEAFQAWRDEAFDVLRQWQRIYPSDSTAYSVLGEQASSRVLVTLIHHEMKNKLWDLFM